MVSEVKMFGCMYEKGRKMPTSKGVQFACESPLSSEKDYRNSFLNIQEMRTECLLCATMYSL